jgi:transcriptional regulator GlxA family with amidase domain
VLEGYQATVHYEHIDAFQELFPNIAVVKPPLSVPILRS